MIITVIITIIIKHVFMNGVVNTHDCELVEWFCKYCLIFGINITGDFNVIVNFIYNFIVTFSVTLSILVNPFVNAVIIFKVNAVQFLTKCIQLDSLEHVPSVINLFENLSLKLSALPTLLDLRC